MAPRKSSSALTGQVSILDYLQAQEAARKAGDPAPGSLSMRAELIAALLEDLRHARDESGRELSRAEVCARMTDSLGEEFSLTTLNNITAPSHPHRFAAEHLAAWRRATNGTRAMEVIARRAGQFLLPGPDALRAEIERYMEQRKSIDSEIRKRRALLDGICDG